MLETGTEMSVRLSREQVNQAFDAFQGKRVLVIGDVMLDSYWWGQVDRISPEAPVPIVNIRKREYRLGGAANVALNLRRLGALPVMCSVIGDDMEGEVLLRQLLHEEISPKGVITTGTRPTTVKTRVIGNKNQLLRIDSEEDSPLPSEDGRRLTDRIHQLIAETELIIFEDYDKGVITENLIEEVVSNAKKLNIPVVVDPKKRNFLSYKNVTLFKPNLRELSEGLKLDLDSQSSLTDIEAAATELLGRLQAEYALITLSDRGVMITGKGVTYTVPAHIRNIYDVSGAGDTVVSVAALAFLAKLPLEAVAAIANLAGGLVCEKVGVVPIEREELLNEALKEFAA